MEADQVNFVLNGEPFVHDPDLGACIVAGLREGGYSYHVVLNPAKGDEDRAGTLRWCAGLLTRVEEHGFERAMEIDGWQPRSDGDFQLWARAHELPSV